MPEKIVMLEYIAKRMVVKSNLVKGDMVKMLRI